MKSEVNSFHASVVDVHGAGLLILGESGVGKSKLALEMIALGAVLVADDLVLLATERERIIARAPRRGFGFIEARGLGILSLPACVSTCLHMAIDLSAPPKTRLPSSACFSFQDVTLPLFHVKGVQGLASTLYLSLFHRILPSHRMD